jgi:hypothetical protein
VIGRLSVEGSMRLSESGAGWARARLSEIGGDLLVAQAWLRLRAGGVLGLCAALGLSQPCATLFGPASRR